MTRKKILVVGGAGFIGSHVNKMLSQAGYDTIVFDNLSRGDTRAVVRGEFTQGDLADEIALDHLFAAHNFSGVMHFAALTDVGESVKNPQLYYTNNVASTITLLRSLIKHNVNNFIFSSSAAVYGIPSQPYINESAVCQPIAPYGRTKLMVEEILQDFEAAYGLQYCALRYFNAAGGDPDGEIKNYKARENNLIPIALKSLLDEKSSISVFGTDYDTPDGTCIRDYIHVQDLAAAHILALESLLAGSSSAIYNLGTGCGFSVKEVLSAIERTTGRHLRAVQGKRRPGDPACLIANAEKAQQSLGWQPQYTQLDEMILHAWKALETNHLATQR